MTTVPISVTLESRSPKGPFRMRSRCGASAVPPRGLANRSRAGPPLGRHDDRSPRSAVDSRQIEAGNARKLLLAYDLSENRYPLFRIIRSIGSQETRELELSQRRMRSPWRVPQQSAGRRARPARARCRPERRREWRNLRALVCGGNGWHAPFGALLPPPLPGANLFLRRCRAQDSGVIAPRE